MKNKEFNKKLAQEKHRQSIALVILLVSFVACFIYFMAQDGIDHEHCKYPEFLQKGH